MMAFMNAFTVAKPFRTPTHRLAVGAAVTADEIDGPLSADDWVALGYLIPPAPAEDAPAPDADH
jgi:hypothetical protein